MSGNTTGVLDKTAPVTPKGEWGQQRQEQRTLLKKQNDYFFNYLHLTKPKPLNDRNMDEQVEVYFNNLDLIGKDDKAKEKEHKKDLKVAEWRPRYEDRLARFEETVTELREYLPATEKVLREYAETRKSARQLVLSDPPGYEAAYGALPSRGDMEKAVQDGEALHGKAMEGARKTVPKPMGLYDALTKDLEAADIGPEAKETLDAKLQGAIFLLLAQSMDVTGFAEGAETKLKQVRTELDQAIAASLQEKQAYDKLLLKAEDADKLLRVGVGLSDQITEAQVGELRRLKQNAASAYAGGEYSLAKDGLQSMLDKYAQMPDIGKTQRDADEKWKQVAGEAAKLIPKIDKVLRSVTVPPGEVDPGQQELVQNKMTLANIGQQLRPRVDRIAKMTETSSMQEKLAASEQIPALRKEFVQWSKRVETFKGFETVPFDKAAACQNVDDRILKLKSKLDSVPDALTQAGVTTATLRSGVIDPLTKRFTEITTGWDRAKQKAFDPTSLGAGDTVKAIRKLADDISQAVDGKKLNTLAQDNEITRARSELRRVITEADAVALLVVSWQPAEGLKFREQIDAAEALVGGTDIQAMDDLRPTLQRSVSWYGTKVQRAKKEVETLRQSIDTALSGVPELIGQIRKVLDDAKSASPAAKKPHAALLVTFEQDLGAVQLLRGCEQIKVLQQAVSDANALKEELQYALPAAKDAVAGLFSLSKTKKGAPTIEKGQEKLLKLAKKGRDAEDAELYLGNTHAELGIKIKDQLDNLGSIAPNKLLKEIDKLKLEYEKMKTKAKDAKEKYQEKDGITAIGKDVEKLFKDPLFTWAPDYLKQVEGELKTILQNGKAEGYYEQALEDAKTFKSEIERVLGSVKNDLGVPVLVIDRQEQAKQAKDDKELDKAKWEGELHVIEKDLKEAKNLNSKEVEALIKQLDECKDTIAKSKDYASGRNEFDDIRTRLALIENNPKGLKITSRNKLKPVNQQFQAALLEFGTATKSFKSIIDKNAELDQKVKDAVAKQLSELRLLFNPSAFVDTVDAMTDTDGNDEKARSAAREKGLREARRMAAYLQHDPRLVQLSYNPFLDAIGAALSKLALSLLDLENNMLVSL